MHNKKNVNIKYSEIAFTKIDQIIASFHFVLYNYFPFTNKKAEAKKKKAETNYTPND